MKVSCNYFEVLELLITETIGWQGFDLFLQSFRKYMTFKKDYNELLLYLLRELVKNALHFEEIVSGSTSRLTQIDVKVEDLQSKVMGT